MKKWLLRIFGGLLAILLGLIIYIQLAWDKKYDFPYPDIVAVKDSAIIARGEYLAYGPAHCATCHMPMDKIVDVENGAKYPLSGGWTLDIPPGTFRAPNLTPDEETGIGKLTDGQIARAMRYLNFHDGSTMFPFMPFQEITDDDLTAIISFLRSQEPVKNLVPRSSPSFLGKAIMAFGLIKPVGPINTPKKSIVKDTTVEYGSYLANNVANCYGCHTNRDLKTGEFIGEDFAGGLYFEPDPFSGGYSYTVPNITPDKETSIMATWDQATFVNRFKKGRVHDGSPMPWGAFTRIDSTEIIALYKYLNSVPPIKNNVGKIVWAPGEKG